MPGQFSEWLHGETLTNEGMMLSPWDPPRYLWAAMEGVVGLDPSGDGVTLHPRLSSDWKWLAVQNLPYRQRRLSYFAVRNPDINIYANFQPHSTLPSQSYDEDISAQVQVGTDGVCAMGLKSGDRFLLFAGNTGEQTVNTSLMFDVPLSGQYRTRLYESLLGEWTDHGLLEAAHFQQGHVLRIERKGFCLLELTQEV